MDLKILTLLLLASNENGEVDDSLVIEDVLGISSAELNASLKFWRGAGVVGASCAQGKKADVSDGGAVTRVEAAHRDGIVESNGVDGYTSTELVALLKRRNELVSFIDEAQKVFGRRCVSERLPMRTSRIV